MASFRLFLCLDALVRIGTEPGDEPMRYPITISDEAQREFILETITSLHTLLRIKQTILQCNFNNTEEADDAVELISEALSDIRYSIFGLQVIPCKRSDDE